MRNNHLKNFLTRDFLLEQLLYQIIMYLPLEALAIPDDETIERIIERAETQVYIKTLSDAAERTVEKYIPYMNGILTQRPALRSCRIKNLSWLDYDGDGKKDHPPEGFVAAVFINDNNNTLFVAFRGTPRGAWLDNARMLIGDRAYCKDFRDLNGIMWHYLSPMQAEAMEYVRALIRNRRMIWDQADLHYVIGHSKGGNQAQLAMMLFPDSFDAALSMNGPGMSAEAIREMKQNLGDEQYEQALSNLIGINAYNDYVHGLGLPLIPYNQNFWFLETACTPIILCSHFVTALLFNEDGQMVPFNADGPGSTAIFMRRLSDEAMAMPVADRADVFMTVMAVLQVIQGKSLPVNALQENWIRLIAGFEEGSIKAASLVGSVLLKSNGGLLELFSN